MVPFKREKLQRKILYCRIQKHFRNLCFTNVGFHNTRNVKTKTVSGLPEARQEIAVNTVLSKKEGASVANTTTFKELQHPQLRQTG